MDVLGIEKLALALGLGLLVGFQREWANSQVAGIRTFALITVFGTVAGLLVSVLGPWIVLVGMLCVAAMVIAGNLVIADESNEPGLTTQIAALTMYGIGVAIALDQMALGIIVGGGVAVLLQWKKTLHTMVDRFGENEIRAIIQLVLIALVILPILPNHDFGPYAVLNPFEIWLMVVLICGISLGGYIAYKFLGEKVGMILGGILGGLISSTATTVSYSRRARRSPATSGLAAFVIAIASAIVFVRVIGEVALVIPSILPSLVPQLSVMMGLMIIASVVLYSATRNSREHFSLDDNPSDLKAALCFGLLYAAVLFAVAAAREHFDNQALYVVAALSGLTDMDAITLSAAQMMKANRISVDTGWRMILLGAMSNLVFKAFVVATLGNRRLLITVSFVFGAALLGGAGLLLFF